MDLLVTITIELLYKAPVDNIGGITEQERQSSFIKKGLVGVGGRQRLHPGRDDLCELGGRWVQSVSPVASLGVINFCIYFLHVYCADVSNAPTHESIMNMHACMLTDVFETLIVMEEGCKMHHLICLGMYAI